MNFRMLDPAEVTVDPQGVSSRPTVTDASVNRMMQLITGNGYPGVAMVRINPEGGYWLVDGERRWRACAKLGIAFKSIVADISLLAARENFLHLNLRDETLSPMEEAVGLHRLQRMTGESQRDLASRLRRSQAWVSHRLRLLRLPAWVQDLLAMEIIPFHVVRDQLLIYSGDDDRSKEIMAGVHRRLQGVQDITEAVVEQAVGDSIREVELGASAPPIPPAPVHTQHGTILLFDERGHYVGPDDVPDPELLDMDRIEITHTDAGPRVSLRIRPAVMETLMATSRHEQRERFKQAIWEIVQEVYL